MKITENFRLKEFLISDTAKKYNIKNEIDDIQHLFNIYELCLLLEKIRKHFNKPIIITSGYRNSELNKKVGGVKNSQHSIGEAVDFHIKDIDNKDAVKWIAENILFDQLILEEYIDKNNQGWIHISFKKDGNRREVLRYNNKKYFNYIP